MVAEFMLPPATLAKPECEPYLRYVTQWAHSMVEAKKILRVLSSGPPEIRSDVRPILAHEERIDILLSCFAQTMLEAGDGDPAAYGKALLAATEVSEIFGFRALVPLQIALSGMIVGPDPAVLARLNTASEIAVRCYAAVSLIKEWRDAHPNPPRPRPAFLSELRRWAQGLLGDRALEPDIQALLKEMDAQTIPVVDAIAHLHVFVPGATPPTLPEEKEILSQGNVDVAFLCFAQIYHKAHGRRADAFDRAMTAAEEVSRLTREDLEVPFRVAVTGVPDWPYELQRTFDMIGAGVVTERIKAALDRIRQNKARFR